MTLKEQLQQMRDATMGRMPQSIIKTFDDSIQTLKNNKLKQKAFQVGDTIGSFILYDAMGREVRSESLLTSDLLILNFYRGGWCPYCNMELREYERLQNDFKALGANIVGISAEVPELTAQTGAKNSLTFPVLTDRDAQFMKSLGIVFPLDEASKRSYAGFGMDFTRIHGNDNYELPVPAVYVINRAGEIVFTHIQEDYTYRLEPSELLQILNEKLIQA